MSKTNGGKTRVTQENKDAYRAYAPGDRVKQFSKFSDETLQQFVEFSKLRLSYEPFVSVRDYYAQKGKDPTFFELRLIDAVWRRGQLAAYTVDQIEIESENPHIKAALAAYRACTAEEEKTTLKSILLAASKMQAGDAPSVLKPLKHSNALLFGERGCSPTGAFALTAESACSRAGIEAGAGYAAISGTVSRGAVPYYAARAECTNSAATLVKNALPFGTYMSELGVSAAGFSPVQSERVREPYEVSFALGVATAESLHEKEILPTDRIVLFFPSHPLELTERTRLFLSLVQKQSYASYVKYTALGEESLVQDLLSFEKGCELWAEALPYALFDLEDITEPNTQTMLAVVKHNALKHLKEICGEAVQMQEIGQILSRSILRVKQEKAVVAEIELDFLLRRTALYTVAKITDKKWYPYAEGAFEERKKEILTRLEEPPATLNFPYDYTAGGNVLYAPFWGNSSVIPTQVIATDITHIAKTRAVVAAFGDLKDAFEDKPFFSAVNSVVLAVSKLVAKGVPLSGIGVSVHGMYPSKEREASFGDAVSASLGVFRALSGLKLPVLSGEFSPVDKLGRLSLHVQAAGVANRDTLISAALRPGIRLFRLPIKRDAHHIPDFKYLLRLYHTVHVGIEGGNVETAEVIETNLVSLVLKSLVGAGLGFSFAKLDDASVSGGFGDLIISAKNIEEFHSLDVEYIGITDNTGVIKGAAVNLTHEEVAAHAFRLKSDPESRVKHQPRTTLGSTVAPTVRYITPRVFVPYLHETGKRLMTRCFEAAGAVVYPAPVMAESIEYEELKRYVRIIKESQIIAFSANLRGGSGGFSEFSRFFLNPIVREAVLAAFVEGEGLMLGMGEGMRALLELGLIPAGRFYEKEEKGSDIRFHTASLSGSAGWMSAVRCFSNLSPWMQGVSQEDTYTAPVSLNPGRLQLSDSAAEALAANGQIVSRFVDEEGYATMQFPFNPTGSAHGIEGICSPDGRILGRFAQIERGRNFLNIPSPPDEGLFFRGVKYFK